MIAAGFDTDAYPGDAEMAALRRETNLMWCGFYLAPAPCHHDTSWMDKRAALATAGWGLAPIYVGRQLDHALAGGGHVLEEGEGTAAGGADGVDAVGLMKRAGFPGDSWVYLDIENGPPLTTNQRQYIVAWANMVKAGGYKPSVYCSHLLAEQVSQAVPGSRIWTVKVKTTARHEWPDGNTFPLYDPHAGGFQFAYLWQHEQNAVLPLGVEVDLNVAILPDPSR